MGRIPAGAARASQVIVSVGLIVGATIVGTAADEGRLLVKLCRTPVASQRITSLTRVEPWKI